MRKMSKRLSLIFVAALAAGGMMLSANAAEDPALSDLRLSVNDCNIIVEFSTDGQYSYDYDTSKFIVDQSTSRSTTAITINPKSKENAKKASMDENQQPIFDMVHVYIPKQSYGTVNISNESAGISLPELNANINYSDNAGAATITLPSDFNKTLNFASVKGAGTIALKENFTDFALTVESKESAFSVPEGFPRHTAGALYEYRQGNGTAKIKVDIENCAFTIKQLPVNKTTDITTTKNVVKNKALIYLNTDNADHMAAEMNVITLDAYLVENNNYFKLRDIAYLFNRTNLNFNVEWNKDKQCIEIKTGTPYLPIGEEISPSSPLLDKAKGTELKVKSNLAAIDLNGKEYTLDVYQIDGFNYFKLRDLSDLLDFQVNWLEGEKAIQLVTESK